MKDVATTSVLTAVNASKYVCDRGSAPDPSGELSLQSSPTIYSWIWGGGREGRGWEGRGREMTKRKEGGGQGSG